MSYKNLLDLMKMKGFQSFISLQSVFLPNVFRIFSLELSKYFFSGFCVKAIGGVSKSIFEAKIPRLGTRIDFQLNLLRK